MFGTRTNKQNICDTCIGIVIEHVRVESEEHLDWYLKIKVYWKQNLYELIQGFLSCRKRDILSTQPGTTSIVCRKYRTATNLTVEIKGGIYFGNNVHTCFPLN